MFRIKYLISIASLFFLASAMSVSAGNKDADLIELDDAGPMYKEVVAIYEGTGPMYHEVMAVYEKMTAK